MDRRVVTDDSLAAVGFQVFLFDRFGVAAAITTVGTVLLLSVASWRLATAGRCRPSNASPRPSR